MKYLPKTQRDFIKLIISKNLVWQAILIGILGNYSSDLMSFIARIATEKTVDNEFFLMFIKSPIVNILYFCISILIFHLLCRLFGSRKPIKSLIIAQGFGGLYAFLISLILTPVILLANYIGNLESSPQVLIFLPIVLVFAVVIIIFYSIKYSITAISEIYEFKIIKSIIIWIIAFVPLFLLYSELSIIR